MRKAGHSSVGSDAAWVPMEGVVEEWEPGGHDVPGRVPKEAVEPPSD